MGEYYNPKPTRQDIQDYPKKSSKIIWIILGIVVFLIIIVGIVIYFSFINHNSNNNISDENLLNGTLVNLKEGDGINFKVLSKEHKIIIDSVLENSVNLTIQSKTIKTSLVVGETKKFDLNEDGIYDIEVKLEDIKDNKLRILIKKISVTICTESWKCSVWEECLNNIKTRNCTDSNKCGTEQNKPSETKSCDVVNEDDVEKNLPTCSKLFGDICNSTEICKVEWLNVSDSNKCCKQLCVPNYTISNEIEFCEAEGLYGGEGECSSESTYYAASGFSCCDMPLTPTQPILKLSDELRNIWDSIQNSGNCTDTQYISKLNTCSPYKCGFIHPFNKENMKKGVIGRYLDKCHSVEETPNNGELYCQYNNSQLTDMINYLTFYEEHCGDETCSIVSNSTGYFIDGILTVNVLQNMYNAGACSYSYG
ncbi:MAG: hypothetical protein Q7R52_05035 [archaeon]|nr:hypothetical protein [archaeon]